MDIDIEKLAKTVAESLNLKDFKGDIVGLKVVENQFDNVEPGGIGIQNVYQTAKPKAARQKKQGPQKPNTKPQTLKYYTHGNNGALMKQRQRVDIVFRKWNEWGWLDDQTTANDFDAFFEGTPRHCNIVFKKSSTLLTLLLQDLIKQEYIQESTGLSAKSLVKQQFGKTPNSDRSRLDADSEEKIKLTLLILDTRNPLPEQNENYEEEEFDTRDEALREIFAGRLRATKGI